MPGATWPIVIKKLALDQLAFSPTFLPGVFLVNDALAGRDWTFIQQHIRSAYWPTLLANWSVWPAVSLLNFRVVPYDLRAPFASAVSLGWNTYLSYKANTGPARHNEVQQKQPPNPVSLTNPSK